MIKREIRFVAELRADSGNDDMALIGYAALFNHESKDLGGFRETIAPGAFTRSLQDNADVKATFNHDPNLVLGRTKSGTLTLKQDDRGLAFRCVLDSENQDHRNLHASVKRGDVDECSFAFTVPKGGQQWAEKKDSNGDAYASRTITEVNLMDVSAVTYPAYGGTTVAARCFPDGISAEIRSAIKNITGVQKRDEDSFEDKISEVSKALSEKFPSTYDDGSLVPAPYNYGKYYICETYDAYVIACNWQTGDYFQIPYHEDEENETFLFGDPVAVEKEWVPSDSERSKKIIGEIRAAFDKSKETRTRAESFEAQYWAKRDQLADALLAKFGCNDNGCRRFYLCETYADHIVACSYDDDYSEKYFSISYSVDASGAYTFGEPAPVELDWVASERTKGLAAEYRAAHKATQKVTIPEIRAHSTEHVEGDCRDMECACQNRDVDPEDVWDEDAPTDEEVGNVDGESSNARAARKLAKTAERKASRVTELRKKSDKVKTKSVDGKNLTKDKFAFVGDPVKTETWKLPIHDADHVRNALARFNQTEGIPAAEKAGVLAKIHAAAKKFGIDVADDNSRAFNDDEIRAMKARLVKAMQ